MTVEKYLTPKELVDELEIRFGLTVKLRKVIEVRMHCVQENNGIFINGLGRASEVFEWMKKHPNIRYKRYTPCVV